MTTIRPVLWMCHFSTLRRNFVTYAGTKEGALMAFTNAWEKHCNVYIDEPRELPMLNPERVKLRKILYDECYFYFDTITQMERIV